MISAFGWQGHRASQSADFAKVLAKALAEKGPSLVVVPIDYRENSLLTKALGEIECTLQHDTSSEKLLMCQ